MKIVSMNCPNCGGTVKITDDQRSCICPFCDSVLSIDDGKIHIVDEAKIKEIEFEQQKYQDELQKEEKRKERRELWKKKCKLWVLIEFVLPFFITFVVKLSHRFFSSKILIDMGSTGICICYFGMIAGSIYLGIVRPDDDYEQNKPPLIKSKILLCVALVLAGAFALGTGVGLAAAI